MFKNVGHRLFVEPAKLTYILLRIGSFYLWEREEEEESENVYGEGGSVWACVRVCMCVCTCVWYVSECVRAHGVLGIIIEVKVITKAFSSGLLR